MRAEVGFGAKQERRRVDRFEHHLPNPRRIGLRPVAKHHAPLGKRFAEQLPFVVGDLNAGDVVNRKLPGEFFGAHRLVEIDDDRRYETLGQGDRDTGENVDLIDLDPAPLLLANLLRRAPAFGQLGRRRRARLDALETGRLGGQLGFGRLQAGALFDRSRLACQRARRVGRLIVGLGFGHGRQFGRRGSRLYFWIDVGFHRVGGFAEPGPQRPFDAHRLAGRGRDRFFSAGGVLGFGRSAACWRIAGLVLVGGRIRRFGVVVGIFGFRCGGRRGA